MLRKRLRERERERERSRIGFLGSIGGAVVVTDINLPAPRK